MNAVTNEQQAISDAAEAVDHGFFAECLREAYAIEREWGVEETGTMNVEEIRDAIATQQEAHDGIR